MKLSHLAAVSCVAVASQGCALFNSVRSGNPGAIAAAAAKQAEQMKEAVRKAEEKCAPVKEALVSFDEERAIGGAIGVSLVSKNGTLLLEGMTEKDPEELNKKIAAKTFVALPDNAVNDMTAYVSVVGKNLARYSARPDLPWTFAVIDNEAVNAFSAPGGYVVLTTALMKKFTNEAQLAGVLGHEIGHVVHKHSLNKYKDAKHMQCVAATTAANVAEAGLPAGAGGEVAKFAKKFDGQMDLDASEGDFVMFIMNAVITILQSGNDKEAEFETDKTALELVSFAGYDASEYEKFLTSLGSQGGGLFGSHPSTEDRVTKLKALREGELAPFAAGVAKPDVSKVLAPLKPKS